MMWIIEASAVNTWQEYASCQIFPYVHAVKVSNKKVRPPKPPTEIGEHSRLQNNTGSLLPSGASAFATAWLKRVHFAPDKCSLIPIRFLILIAFLN